MGMGSGDWHWVRFEIGEVVDFGRDIKGEAEITVWCRKCSYMTRIRVDGYSDAVGKLFAAGWRRFNSVRSNGFSNYEQVCPVCLKGLKERPWG